MKRDKADGTMIFLSKEKTGLSKYVSLLGIVLVLSLAADVEETKQSLKPNYALIYNVLPPKVNSLPEIFTEAMAYGRLRSNWFFFQYEDEVDPDYVNHNILGVGGSLVYKTAPYAGFSTTTGLYYTSAGTGWDDQSSDLGALRSGKDVISRYNAFRGEGSSFSVLAQANVRYEFDRSEITVGRQIVNSFFTKSNDTKMIPNTFEGVVVETSAIEKTHLSAAYITRQKLRDHDNFHSVIMYDDRDTDAKSHWDGNDDSANHRGLSYVKFKEAGQDETPGLFLIDGNTRALLTKDLKVSGAALYLKDLFSTAMLELNYQLALGDGYILTPGIRYVQQFDDGAGKLAGASLNGLAASDSTDPVYRSFYTNPDSVDASMAAARLVVNKNAGSLSLGYSKVADEADFITPWRGFVTGGYTRTMGRYNWIANTQTYRVLGSYDFVNYDLKTYLSFTHEDYDQQKVNGDDANVYYLGLIKEIEEVPNLSFRFRTEFVDQTIGSIDNYAEARAELNYLF